MLIGALFPDLSWRKLWVKIGLMLQSKLFTKTRREDPKDEVAKNAKLLIRSGYVHKEMAGVYSYLPLGLRVLNKIAEIIRSEMNALGGQEVQLTVLQDKELWEKTGRWADGVVDIWFKTELKNGGEIGLGHTHEEELTNLLCDYIQSFRDLPISVYQIQTKLRNETRAKSGIMRGREFLMKDMYSFSRDEAEHSKFYEAAKVAYQNIFAKAGVGDSTYLTFAAGGSFSKYSHEFQTLTEAGEDQIYICEKCRVAINEEIIKEVSACPSCGNKDLVAKKAVEVGNIFNLGTRFSEPLGLIFADEVGEKKPVVMGCYGIGLGRLMGAIVELFSDDKGLVWPLSVAPFALHILSLEENDTALRLASDLESAGFEVLVDDREVSAGAKFADADLLGLPYRVIVSAKNLASGQLEIKQRQTGIIEFIPLTALSTWAENHLRP